jgi:hypothetical protein
MRNQLKREEEETKVWLGRLNTEIGFYRSIWLSQELIPIIPQILQKLDFLRSKQVIQLIHHSALHIRQDMRISVHRDHNAAVTE